MQPPYIEDYGKKQALHFRYGAMGLLRTVEDWQGQGCAKASINALAFELTKSGVTPYVYIESFNDASINLFEKLGYRRVCDVFWVGYSPSNH